MAEPIAQAELDRLDITADQYDLFCRNATIGNGSPGVVVAKALISNPRVRITKGKSYLMPLGFYASMREQGMVQPSSDKLKYLFKPHSGDDFGKSKVLVARQGGFGDLIYVHTVLKHWKALNPKLKIGFITQPNCVDFVKAWGVCDAVYTYPLDVDRAAEYKHFFPLDGYVENKKDFNLAQEFATLLGSSLTGEQLLPPDPRVDPRDIGEWQQVLRDEGLHQGGFVLYQASSFAITRTLPIDQNAAGILSITRRGYPVVIMDKPNKAPYIKMLIEEYIKQCDELDNGGKPIAPVIDFSPLSKSFDHAVALAWLAGCIVSPASSFLTIGQALRSKIVGIFGPHPFEKIRIPGDGMLAVSTKAKCAGCQIQGYVSCVNCRQTAIGPTSICYDEMDMDEVGQRVEEHLGKA